MPTDNSFSLLTHTAVCVCVCVCSLYRAELQRKIERSRQKQQELEEELRRWQESLLEYLQQVGDHEVRWGGGGGQ